MDQIELFAQELAEMADDPTKVRNLAGQIKSNVPELPEFLKRKPMEIIFTKAE